MLRGGGPDYKKLLGMVNVTEGALEDLDVVGDRILAVEKRPGTNTRHVITLKFRDPRAKNKPSNPSAPAAQ